KFPIRSDNGLVSGLPRGRPLSAHNRGQSEGHALSQQFAGLFQDPVIHLGCRETRTALVTVGGLHGVMLRGLRSSIPILQTVPPPSCVAAGEERGGGLA